MASVYCDTYGCHLDSGGAGIHRSRGVVSGNNYIGISDSYTAFGDGVPTAGIILIRRSGVEPEQLGYAKSKEPFQPNLEVV